MWFKKEDNASARIKLLESQIEDLEERIMYEIQNNNELEQKIKNIEKPLSKDGLNSISENLTNQINDIFVQHFDMLSQRNNRIKSLLEDALNIVTKGSK